MHFNRRLIPSNAHGLVWNCLSRTCFNSVFASHSGDNLLCWERRCHYFITFHDGSNAGFKPGKPSYFLIPSITFGGRAPSCCNDIKEQFDALPPKVGRFLVLCVIFCLPRFFMFISKSPMAQYVFMQDFIDIIRAWSWGSTSSNEVHKINGDDWKDKLGTR